MALIALKIEFGGGLELLFSKQRNHAVSIQSHVPIDNRTQLNLSSATDNAGSTAVTEQKQKPADITYLIHYLRDHLLKEREELFMENGTVRPGILVLINDTDWELEGEGDYVLKDGDEVVFISTLHGGLCHCYPILARTDCNPLYEMGTETPSNSEFRAGYLFRDGNRDIPQLEISTTYSERGFHIIGASKFILRGVWSDLEWNKLDSSLAFYLVDVLNRQLSSAERPSFIGPVEVTSLDFGSTSPDVELIDLRDIYRDFLDDNDDLDRAPVKVAEGAEDEEGFEWVSRRAGGYEEGLAYHHLPPHVRYGSYGSASMFAASPSLNPPADVWSTGMSLPNLIDHRHTPWTSVPMYRSPSPATPFSTPALNNPELDIPIEMPSSVPVYDTTSNPLHSQPDLSHLHETAWQPPQQTEHPNLQLHLHINWNSNLRITLTTSLLINYPSPMFMSLPIKLSVTGLVFTGELAVAYEGARRRVHICILDDLDPYGPAATGDRPKRSPNLSGSAGSTPPELDEDSPQASAGSGRFAKPLPVGQRLLPSIYIESEIGQTDKHVLKNVTRVERFIQDVIRKTIEEELVFPNFHTLVIGDG